MVHPSPVRDPGHRPGVTRQGQCPAERDADDEDRREHRRLNRAEYRVTVLAAPSPAGTRVRARLPATRPCGRAGSGTAAASPAAASPAAASPTSGPSASGLPRRPCPSGSARGRPEAPPGDIRFEGRQGSPAVRGSSSLIACWYPVKLTSSSSPEPGRPPPREKPSGSGGDPRSSPDGARGSGGDEEYAGRCRRSSAPPGGETPAPRGSCQPPRGSCQPPRWSGRSAGPGLLADLVASVLNATIRPSDGWRRRGAAVPSAAGPDRIRSVRAALSGRSRTGSEKFRAGS